MMKIAIAPVLMLVLLAGCGDKKMSSTVEELRSKNETLTKRVEILESQQLESDKKVIQHQQALQAMHERLRGMEAELDRARMGGT